MTSVCRGLVAQRERLDGDPLGLELVLDAVRVGDGAQGAHQRLERDRPVVLRAEQQPHEVGPGRAVHVRSLRRCAASRDVPQVLDRHPAQDGQSCGVSSPQTSSRVRDPLGLQRRASARVEGSACVGCSSHAPRPTQSWTNTGAPQPVQVVAMHVLEVGERVVEVERRRRARPSRSTRSGRSCPTCPSACGNRSARRSARFTAWKAPEADAGGRDGVRLHRSRRGSPGRPGR